MAALAMVLAGGFARANRLDSAFSREKWLDSAAPLNLAPSNRLQLAGNLAAYVTTDSIHLKPLLQICPLAVCSECGLEQSRWTALPLPGIRLNAPPVMGILDTRENGPDFNGISGSLAVIGGNSMLYRISFSIDGGTRKAAVARMDSIRIEPAANGRTPSLLVSAREAGLSRDSSLLVAGSNGLLMRIQWKDGKLSSSIFLQVPEDLTAFGRGWFGGVTGGVFRFDGSGELVESGRPFPAAIRLIDETGAVGDQGWIAARDGDVWRPLAATPGAYHGFRTVLDERGLGVLLYAGSAAPAHIVVRDVRSALAAILRLNQPLPRDQDPIRYAFNDVREELRVVFFDPEGNYGKPVFDFTRAAGGTVDLAAAFVPGRPGSGCAVPGICLQPGADTVDLRLFHDTLRITMRVHATDAYALCGKPRYYHRKDSVFTTFATWKKGDRLEITIGEDRRTLDLDAVTGWDRPRPSGAGLVRRARAGFDAAGREVGAEGETGMGNTGTRAVFPR